LPRLICLRLLLPHLHFPVFVDALIYFTVTFWTLVDSVPFTFTRYVLRIPFTFRCFALLDVTVPLLIAFTLPLIWCVYVCGLFVAFVCCTARLHVCYVAVAVVPLPVYRIYALPYDVYRSFTTVTRTWFWLRLRFTFTPRSRFRLPVALRLATVITPVVAAFSCPTPCVPVAATCTLRWLFVGSGWLAAPVPRLRITVYAFALVWIQLVVAGWLVTFTVAVGYSPVAVTVARHTPIYAAPHPLRSTWLLPCHCRAPVTVVTRYPHFHGYAYLCGFGFPVYGCTRLVYGFPVPSPCPHVGSLRFPHGYTFTVMVHAACHHGSFAVALPFTLRRYCLVVTRFARGLPVWLQFPRLLQFWFTYLPRFAARFRYRLFGSHWFVNVLRYF